MEAFKPPENIRDALHKILQRILLQISEVSP